MRFDLQQALKHLQHALWILIWCGASVLIWIWTPVGAVGFAGVGLVLYLWALRRGAFKVKPGTGAAAAADPADRRREAEYMVTQILRNLTRVQVAYLCQDFKNRAEGRRWLKTALPRGYRQNLEELQARLERARVGHEVEGMELTQRIIGLRAHVLGLIESLERLHKEHPDHVVSNPVIFVITENISEERREPLVVTLAGWNPEKRTLLPQVDALTFFSELEGGRHVRGQAEFDGARDALNKHFRVISKKPRIYDAQPVEGDLASLGVKLSKVPLGFVIGTAELL